MGQRDGQSDHLTISLGFMGVCKGQVTEGRRRQTAHGKANQPAARIGVKVMLEENVPYSERSTEAQRTSLVVQWLGLCAPKAGGSGSIPGQNLDPVCCN